MTKTTWFKRALLGVGLIAAAGPVFATALVAAAPSVDVSGFKTNPQLILSLYNVAQQSGGIITSYPANLDPAVITVTVTNKDQQNPVTPCFRIDVYDDSGSSSPVITGGLLTMKTAMKAGEVRVATANDFQGSGSFTGAISQNLQDEFKNDFKDVDASKIAKVVDMLLKRKYRICLVPIDCAAGLGGSPIGSSSCDIFTLFTGSPMGDCSVPIIIYPHNNGIYSAYPTFVWAPAQNRSCAQGDLSYQIEIMKDDEGGAPYARVKTAKGVSFYQWQASDPIIEPGHKYFWRIVGLDCNGLPFCGPSGQGWNIIKWFTFENQGDCHYTLGDIDDFVRKNANPDIQAKLKGYLAKRLDKPNGFSDPFVCRLLSGQAKLNSIEFQTK